MRSRLRSARREERGQVLVIVAGAMIAILAIAAFAIDVGSWYQAKRQVQSSVDAAALAAVQDLPSNPTLAATDAQSYVSKNYPGATASVTTPYGGSANRIHVSVTVSSPSYFGKVLGVTSATITADAVASVTPATNCAVAGNTCYAIFTSDSNCGTAGSPLYSITLNGSGSTITGGVSSNGGINLIGGSQHLGPTTYGTGANCTTHQGGSGDTFTNGPSAQAPKSWPLDYATILTPCGGGGQVACTGPNGTPSYCTKAQANFDFPTDPITTNNVYCAYGTGTRSDPSTWTGLIYFHSGSFGTSSSPLRGTWIGGTVDVGRAAFLAPQVATPSYPVFYAAGAGTCASPSVGGICMTAGGSGVNGAMFSPNGTIQFSGSGSTANFLEAKDVSLIGQSFTGNGPTFTGGGGSTGGAYSLLQ